jgi:hypothetical protein
MSIAFLHTAAVHVPTFDGLMRELAPGHPASHVVDESLLADARRLGIDDSGVVSRVNEAMARAATPGTHVVVCTCSTVGGIAERSQTQGQFIAMRIDRAMANEAVRLGPSVLVVAALESTLSPTQDLVHDSSRRIGKAVRVSTLAVPEAWQHFTQGDVSGYLATIAARARAAARGMDVVVLAQASMAGAAELLADLNMPVLSSPRLGVQAAIQRVQSQRSA